MQIVVQTKILPSIEQHLLIHATAMEYICLVNQVVSGYVAAAVDLKYTSKSVHAKLPGTIKNQAIQDANCIFRKYTKDLRVNSLKQDGSKSARIPVLKKPVAIWNNQNYSIGDGDISFPVWADGKCKRISVNAIITDRQRELLKNKLGTLRISKKSGKWIAQIAVTIPDSEPASGQVMGVDLGLKIPAVAVTEEGRTAFFGNGRMNKYVRRKYASTRKKLGRAKKLKAIKKIGNKEQRWMKDQDHKISKRIVRFASANKVGTIRLEKLSGIRQTARTSRKNRKNLHTWSFYRLANFIEYKSNLAGIKVEYVDPRHTSQKCPACGELNKAVDRKYKCGCGFKGHRDRVGALNIISAPVVDGKRLSARNAKRTVAGRANDLALNSENTLEQK